MRTPAAVTLVRILARPVAATKLVLGTRVALEQRSVVERVGRADRRPQTRIRSRSACRIEDTVEEAA